MPKIIDGQEYLTSTELSESLDKKIEASREVLRSELHQSQKNNSTVFYV